MPGRWWAPLAVVFCLCYGMAEADVVGVVVCGKPLELGAAPGLVNGIVCGPVGLCAKMAGASAQWNRQTSTLSITGRNGVRVTLTAGRSSARIGGADVPLKAPLQVREGAIWGPLTPVLEALGCRIHWKSGSSVFRANGVLRGFTVHAGHAGARIAVTTTTPVQGATGSLDQPARRYVDLPGIELERIEGESRAIFTGIVARVRAGQTTSGPLSSRIVADLKVPATVRWIPAEDGCGGTLLVGKDDGALALVERNFAKLTEITTQEPARGVQRICACVNWPLNATPDLLLNPSRVTLTFDDVTPGFLEQNLAVPGEFVQRIAVATQGSPARTTVTLYLNELIRYELLPLEDGGTEVIFRRERLADQTIAIDPGHGGHDAGATGRVLQEKDVNFDVATRTMNRLLSLGAHAFLTRPGDVYVALNDRPALSDRIGADVFVAIHCNAMPRRNEGHGTETYYWRADSKCLATLIQGSLVRTLGRVDRGVKQARFAVIRQGRAPAVLTELMFLNDDKEEALLQQDAVREQAAVAIVEGLRQYVEGSGTWATASAPGAAG